MKTSTPIKLTTALLAASAACAAPIKRSDITDTEILQFALTLEHLEVGFYSHFLGKFSVADFEAANFSSSIRGRVEQIFEHEQQHVALLTAALGDAAPQACNYSFPSVTDVSSFLAMGTIVEQVGTSAYLGAAPLLQSKDYLAVAGSILTTEARQQSWFDSFTQAGPPWSGPEETALGGDEVFSIASTFIVSCPNTNPPLPFTAFPTLSITDNGTVITSVSTENTFIQLLSGLESDTFPVVNGQVHGLPAPQGISYAVLTTEQNTTLVSSENIIAGTFVMNHPFGANMSNPAPSF